MAKLEPNYQGKFELNLKTVKDAICELKIDISTLELELHIRETVTDDLSKYIKTLERKYQENEQYSRRESLEMRDILRSIDDNDLEEAGLNLFSKVNAPVDSTNFEDCHRHKTTRNVP